MGCYDRIQAYLLLEEEQRSSRLPPKDERESWSERGSWSEPKYRSTPGSAGEGSEPENFLLQIKNGSFSYGTTGRPVLQNLSLDIPSGSITIVLGPSGSGKSTLLKAMLGEVAIKDGSIQSYVSSVGYCPHDSWLPNLSLHDIIMGVSEYDDEWLATVLHACALDEDLLRLSKGIHTPVGTKGVVLSGGQRQRLASNNL
jgi:ABC-type bacteriocin/lantibiotic exporter with double-glycine peptidase domain